MNGIALRSIGKDWQPTNASVLAVAQLRVLILSAHPWGQPSHPTTWRPEAETALGDMH
jgi:hypothetical protein